VGTARLLSPFQKPGDNIGTTLSESIIAFSEPDRSHARCSYWLKTTTTLVYSNRRSETSVEVGRNRSCLRYLGGTSSSKWSILGDDASSRIKRETRAARPQGRSCGAYFPRRTSQHDPKAIVLALIAICAAKILLSTPFDSPNGGEIRAITSVGWFGRPAA